MLVLARNKGQKVIIGNRVITITVCSIDGNQVKLGIEAPKDVAVNREEIYKNKIKNPLT